MLFVLDEDLLPFARGADSPTLNGLQNLLLSVRQGVHAVAGAHNVFVALSRNASLASRERSTALRLVNRKAELPTLLTLIKAKIIVLHSLGGRRILRVDDSTWKIAADGLNSQLLSKLMILAENIVDSEVLHYSARHYQIFNKIKGVSLVALTRGGGGSQIDVELRQLLNSGFPVFAVTDGDLTHPESNKSVISKRCDAAVATEICVGWHHAIEAREIENILPKDLLLELADPILGPNAYESIRQLEELEDTLGVSLQTFVCLKYGISLKEVFGYDSQAHKVFWLTVARKLAEINGDTFLACMENGTCSNADCECSLSTGFGGHILSQVNVWLSKRSVHQSLKVFSRSAHWMSIGAKIFDAGVAFNAERT